MQEAKTIASVCPMRGKSCISKVLRYFYLLVLLLIEDDFPVMGETTFAKVQNLMPVKCMGQILHRILAEINGQEY